jgi:hypothetical protein
MDNQDNDPMFSTWEKGTVDAKKLLENLPMENEREKWWTTETGDEVEEFWRGSWTVKKKKLKQFVNPPLSTNYFYLKYEYAKYLLQLIWPK